MMRIVQGVPMSWDPITATIKYPHMIKHSVWSPCSRFIAIDPQEPKRGIRILDAVTLNQVKLFTPPQDHDDTQLVAFSTESHLLTWLGVNSDMFISWDLQTGVVASEIPIKGDKPTGTASSITYSQCGTMFRVLFENGYTSSTIGTYNVLSSTPIYYHSITGMVITIWTHGECLQLAHLGSRSITIWEVRFTSKQPAMEVKSLPTPDKFDSSRRFLFLPTLSRLAFVLDEGVLVWDTQHSKFLLNSVDVEEPRMTFSSDGHFFACSDGPKIYLWKESPTGYILHQKLIFGSGGLGLLISPNGESVDRKSVV